MKKASLFFFLLIDSFLLCANPFPLNSPNGKIKTEIKVDQDISFSVAYKGQEIFRVDQMALFLKSGHAVGVNDRAYQFHYQNSSDEYTCIIPTKHATIQEAYNVLTLDLSRGFSIEFRVYNDGCAYRFISKKPGELIIQNEGFVIDLLKDTEVFFPEESSLISHNERQYQRIIGSEIEEDKFCSLPVLFNTSGNTKILFSESDLLDYPGLWLEKGKGSTFGSLFSKYPLDIIPREGSEDRNEIILETADFIAKTKGKRTFPWRTFIIGSEKELIESTLIYQLASPSKVLETDWIKPGQVVWDWYNANNIYGVDFESGINTETYKYYIDFAGEYGIPYIILDEGWSKSTTETKVSNENIDIPALVEYGKEKGVELILWTLWKPLSKDKSGILSLYHSWGIAGVKVDFMQRSDQLMVNYYEEVAREAAKHQLLVDFHGCYKPTGLHKTYPNVLTFEGVKGNENNKWSQLITPEHNLTIPFIRMSAGPMDYTPGAMINKQMDNHLISFTRPEGLGTRVHEMAKYVVYESPLQMLCDAPPHYIKEPGITEFITQVPVTWDETIFIRGEISEYLLVARRKGNDWFIAGMTNWEERELSFELFFLGEGNYEATILKDGINANKYASDYKLTTETLTSSETMNVKMAKGGGWISILKKI